MEWRNPTIPLIMWWRWKIAFPVIGITHKTYTYKHIYSPAMLDPSTNLLYYFLLVRLTVEKGKWLKESTNSLFHSLLFMLHVFKLLFQLQCKINPIFFTYIKQHEVGTCYTMCGCPQISWFHNFSDLVHLIVTFIIIFVIELVFVYRLLLLIIDIAIRNRRRYR